MAISAITDRDQLLWRH